MIGNAEYNADAYDIKCRVPSCPFGEENLTPELAAMQLLEHIGSPCSLDGEPVYTMRIREGFEGLDPDNPVRTAEDGWFRSTTPSDQ